MANIGVTAPPGSDEALALKFAERHESQLKYVASWSTWLLWDGRRWTPERTLRALDLARAVVREAAVKRTRRSSAQIGRTVASAGTAAAVERLAKADRRIASSSEDWDSDPWVLNTPSGLVDLKTGVISVHDPAHRITKITSVGPGGECPLWHEFLERITAGDLELQRYLQRMAGYALTGSTREEAMFFLFGTGGNGKSVFIDALAGILGDYHRTAAPETFVASAFGRHPTELAALRGARLVTVSETEDGKRWDDVRVKAMTGGDRVSARFVRNDFFEYTPQFKLCVAGNHKPSFRKVDEAIRRRLHLVPFAVTIPASERDDRLAEKLQAEWGGILSWAIEGCLAWSNDRLCVPPAVRAATEGYLAAEDVVGHWIEECCQRGAREWGTSKELYTSWQLWAERAGEAGLSQKALANELEVRGCRPDRFRGQRGFWGISLQATQELAAG